jgi:hypothetical protein
VTTLLCASRYCALPGLHADCEDPECRGCMPARAADGLYLCPRCAGLLERDPWTAARLHAALGQALIGGGGERGPRGASVGLDLNDVALEARTAIRGVLVALCRMVAEERGVALPADDVTAMAGYLSRHARWLAAHRAAGEHAQDLRDTVTDGRTWRVAYATAGDRTLIGVCNQPHEAPSGGVGPCGARIYVRDPDADIECAGCGTVGSVPWWRWELCAAADGGIVVDAYAAAAYLSYRWARVVDPGLVRKWGQRHPAAGMLRELVDVTPLDGAVERELVEGKPLKDLQGRVLFVLGMVERYAAKRWGEPLEALARVGG